MRPFIRAKIEADHAPRCAEPEGAGFHCRSLPAQIRFANHRDGVSHGIRDDRTQKRIISGYRDSGVSELRNRFRLSITSS